MSVAIAAANKNRIETKAAPARIAAGACGVCEACEEPIPATRLEAVSHTR